MPKPDTGKPDLKSPGVYLDERDFPFHGGDALALPEDHPIEKAKGNIGWAGMEAPQALPEGNLPYAGLRSGRK